MYCLGDLRNCLNQLCSDSPNLARILFEYRFRDSGELSDHNLGNLILLAMDQMCVRPMDAINLIRQMLQVDVQLIPMSEQPASLAGFIKGEQVVGETLIDCLSERPERLMLLPAIQPTHEAVAAIENADLIILGPGSFMTSVLPALLMEDIAEAIADSKALTVFVGNINPEQSSVKTMEIEEKLSWMEEMTGVYPDVLLWPEERSLEGELNCSVYRQALADHFQPGVHSREALRQALDGLMLKYGAMVKKRAEDFLCTQ